MFLPSSLLLNCSNLLVAQSCKCRIFNMSFSSLSFRSVRLLAPNSSASRCLLIVLISEYWYSIVCIKRFKLKYFFEHVFRSAIFSLSSALSCACVSLQLPLLLSKISRLFFSFLTSSQLLYFNSRSLLAGSVHTQQRCLSGT